MNEPLTKVTHDLGFVCDGLQEALKKANTVQGIVLLDIIRRTGDLLQQIKALREASNADAKRTVKP